MKRAGLLGILAIAVVALATGGCSTPRERPSSPVSSLDGSWEGNELGNAGDGLCRLTISGNQLEFRGSHPGEWYKGSFTTLENAKPKRLIGLIADCPAPGYIGKNVQAIYKIEGHTLTLTGSEPGRSEVPDAFEAPGTRTFVLRKL